MKPYLYTLGVVMAVLFGWAQLTGKGPFNVPPTKVNTRPAEIVPVTVGGQPPATEPATPTETPTVVTVAGTPKVTAPVVTVTTPIATTAHATGPRVVTPGIHTPVVVPVTPVTGVTGPKVVTPGVGKPTPVINSGDGAMESAWSDFFKTLMVPDSQSEQTAKLVEEYFKKMPTADDLRELTAALKSAKGNGTVTISADPQVIKLLEEINKKLDGKLGASTTPNSQKLTATPTIAAPLVSSPSAPTCSQGTCGTDMCYCEPDPTTTTTWVGTCQPRATYNTSCAHRAKLLAGKP
jgi:hypothetical protein